MKITIEQYLHRLGLFVDDEFGQRVRQNFQDDRGSSELAMLETPSSEEYEQLEKAVAIMTPSEKTGAENLTDEQVLKIAEDAGIDEGMFAIFVNGYVLECMKNS